MLNNAVLNHHRPMKIDRSLPIVVIHLQQQRLFHQIQIYPWHLDQMLHLFHHYLVIQIHHVSQHFPWWCFFVLFCQRFLSDPLRIKHQCLFGNDNLISISKEKIWKYWWFNLDGKPNVPSTQQQQQSSSSSISSLSSTSNVSLTNPPNPTGSPYSVISSINDDPTVESTRLKLAHRLAI